MHPCKVKGSYPIYGIEMQYSALHVSFQNLAYIVLKATSTSYVMSAIAKKPSNSIVVLLELAEPINNKEYFIMNTIPHKMGQ